MNDTLNSKLITLGGLTTHYLEAGDPADADATVLLVHDGWFGADAATLWAGVIERLAEEYHVLAPDMLGFGRTDKVVFFDRSMYTYRSAHLGSFIRAACSASQSVHAVGTSMGGSILMRDAARADSQIPVHSVVSISGSGGPWRSAFGGEQLADYSGTLDDIARVMAHMADDFDGYETVIAERHENTTVPGHVEALLAAQVKHPAGGKKPSPGDWPDALRHIEVPMTVVAGERDPLLEPGWQEHLVGLSDLLVTRAVDAKHAPSLDHPDLVADEVRRHISRTLESAVLGEEH